MLVIFARFKNYLYESLSVRIVNLVLSNSGCYSDRDHTDRKGLHCALSHLSLASFQECEQYVIGTAVSRRCFCRCALPAWAPHAAASDVVSPALSGSASTDRKMSHFLSSLLSFHSLSLRGLNGTYWSFLNLLIEDAAWNRRFE